MNTRTLRTTASGLAFAALLMAGCGGSEPPQPGDQAGEAAAQSWIGRQAAAGIAKAQRELETENIRIGKNVGFTVNGRTFGARDADGLPRAEITPQGDLLIQGEPVPVNDAQRGLLLEHRRQLIGLAQAGMAIGIKGADIADVALTGLGSAVFGGRAGRKDYGERIEAEAARIEEEAMQLCSLLPGLYDSQQALAAALPGFAPYATMTREDIDECGRDRNAKLRLDASPGARRAPWKAAPEPPAPTGPMT